MLQALLLAAAIAWLYWRGYLGAKTMRALVLLAGAAFAAWLLARRQFAAGGVVGAVVALTLLRQRLGGRTRRRRSGTDEEQARRLLGVGVAATRADILAAHRRRIAEVHPDVGGGDAGLASKVNAARDLLLSRLPPS